MVLACLPVVLAEQTRADRRLTPGVIPPGREDRVMAFAAMPAIRAEGPTITVSDVQIDRDAIVLRIADARVVSTCPNVPSEIRVWLALDVDDSPCGSNPSLHAGDLCAGARECDAWMDLHTAMLARIASRLAARAHAGIWSAGTSAPRGEVGGLLAPVMRRTSMPIARGVCSMFALALLFALLAAWRLGALASAAMAPPVEASTRSRWISSAVLLAVTCGGAWRRVVVARTLAFDNDEQWAFPSRNSIISDDHDAWVHPPLHRALQQAWVHAIRWHHGDSLVSLRAVSLACGVCALAALALAILRTTRTTWTGAPFAIVALASVYICIYIYI